MPGAFHVWCSDLKPRTPTAPILQNQATRVHSLRPTSKLPEIRSAFALSELTGEEDREDEKEEVLQKKAGGI